jgi:hypothetical protein
MTMRVVTNFLPPRPIKLDADACQPQTDAAATGVGAQLAGNYLKQFREIVTMIELIDRLPNLADDIRDWRPHNESGHFASAGDRPNAEILRAFGALNPLMRRSFQAVTAGLDKLAESAVDLCDPKRKPLTPGEMEACAEIGRSMRRLLERAVALVESAQTQNVAAAQARNLGAWRQNEMRSSSKPSDPRIARS